MLNVPVCFEVRKESFSHLTDEATKTQWTVSITLCVCVCVLGLEEERGH